MIPFDVTSWNSTFIVLVIAGTILLYKYIGRNDDYWKIRGVRYAPRPSFLYLMYLTSKMTLDKLILRSYKMYGRLCGSFELSTPILMVAEPELLRNILVKDFQIFPDRRELILGDEITDSMLTILKGEDWKRVRTIITPAFTSKRMRQMGSIINNCSMTVLETCDQHFKRGEPVDCRGIFGAFTMDVIASAAFGTKIDSYNDPENLFVRKAKEYFLKFSFLRVMIKLMVPKWIFKVLNFLNIGTYDFFRDVTLQVIKERKESGKRYNDVLQILMDAREEETPLGNSELNEDENDHFGSITDNGISHPIKYKHLSEIELLAQCVMFFFVGYETTAATLSHLAYSLALNPEWQDRLIAEVDETFKKHTEMGHDAVRDMKVLNAVVSETLRLYPAVVVAERTAVEDYKLGDTDIIVEKGMRIGIPIYAMHYDAEFFEEPERFNPNRFLDPDQMKHPPYAYLPFGAGPRNCLGMRLALLEIKLSITNVLRHYKFRRHSTTKVPLEYKKGSGFLTVDNLPLTLERRTDVVA